ncbi:hypothetical protein niasHT_029956 [Heterodera trifolii]|uniref:Uncharacterized protein n=1 Tax=Heterodera trifolii TaxID=157864 RepID=A0ABD2JW90_9BILA
MLSLEDAAKQRLSVLDTSKGVLVGLSNRCEMSVRDAYAKGLFEDVGDALHLAALLDVHPSLLTPAMDA